MHVRYDAKNLLLAWPPLFKTKFVLYDQVDHQRSADANGEPQNVDEGKNPVLPEIANRDREEIFDHARVSMLNNKERFKPTLRWAGKCSQSHARV